MVVYEHARVVAVVALVLVLEHAVLAALVVAQVNVQMDALQVVLVSVLANAQVNVQMDALQVVVLPIHQHNK